MCVKTLALRIAASEVFSWARVSFATPNLTHLWNQTFDLGFRVKNFRVLGFRVMAAATPTLWKRRDGEIHCVTTKQLRHIQEKRSASHPGPISA